MAKVTSGKSLRFTHLYLENWRNFTRVDVDLQRRVFLVGPNASGKSNFLDVFRFLRDIVAVGGGVQEAVGKRGGVSSLRCLSARKNPRVLVRVRVGNEENPFAWEYELQFGQDKQRRLNIKRERVTKKGLSILVRPDEKDLDDPARLTQTYLEQVYANQDFRDVANFFGSINYLHIVPQLIREPDRSVGRNNDPYGGDFLEQIARTMKRTREARLGRIVKALRVAVPQLKDLELGHDFKGTPHLHGRYANWRPHGTWQTEERFSDGTLRLLGLLWAILSGTGPLLLEEPELSLHPEAVRYIPQMFARVQRHSARQVLVSTHSPELLRDDGIGLDEVLLLRPGAEGTSIIPAAKFSEIDALLQEGMSLGDAVMPRTRPANVQQLALFPDF